LYTTTIAVFPTLIQYFLAGPPIGLIVVVLTLLFICSLVVQFQDCTSKPFYHDVWLGLRRLWALCLRRWAALGAALLIPIIPGNLQV
jgi:hypothetical protein